MPVLSSLLLLCRPWWENLINQWSSRGKVGARGAFKPQASFPHDFRPARLQACTRFRSTARLRRCGQACSPWQRRRSVCSGVQSIQPGSDGHAFALDPPHSCSGTMDRDFAQVAVARLLFGVSPQHWQEWSGLAVLSAGIVLVLPNRITCSPTT